MKKEKKKKPKVGRLVTKAPKVIKAKTDYTRKKKHRREYDREEDVQ